MTDSFFTSPLRADFIEAQAIGEPGHRRFRLAIVADGRSFLVWLEKEQVEALAIAITNLYPTTEQNRVAHVASESFPLDEEAAVHLRADRIAVAVEGYTRELILSTTDVLVDDDGVPRGVSVILSQRLAMGIPVQWRMLSRGGRPVCAFCGTIMQPGVPHVCPQQNGHLPDDEDFSNFFLV